MTVHSFNALSNPDATVLILGTMPGVASLDAMRYYAHPRNAFWPILIAWASGNLPDFDTSSHTNYEQKVSILSEAGFALWDVLATCERDGSLDSAIKAKTAKANDFAAFFDQHTAIKRILFNGKTAEKLFKKHALPTLQAHHKIIESIALPSTSPAYASMNLNQKASRWHRAFQLN